MKHACWVIETVLFVLLSLPLSVLPYRLSLKTGEFLGLLLFYIWGSRRDIASENIKTAIARNAITLSVPPESIIKENFKNLGRSFVEVIKIYYGFGKKILDAVIIEGEENFRKAISIGKGVIFVTGHCGNWELLAIAFSSKVSNIAVVARPLNNPYLNRLLERARGRYGNSVIYKKSALKNIFTRLRSEGIVGILIDQSVVPSEGYVIDFLGRGAWTTKMPAIIARKTGAPILPAFIRRDGDGHLITLGNEIKLSYIEDQERAIMADTQTFSNYIEEYIRQNPSEWLWMHRRWKRV